MRILSAEATIQLQDLRKGLKGQEQWNKLARIMGKIGDAPLFIDDSPNMSLMEIRAKVDRDWNSTKLDVKSAKPLE